jgi:hypothetical protein
MAGRRLYLHEWLVKRLLGSIRGVWDTKRNLGEEKLLGCLGISNLSSTSSTNNTIVQLPLRLRKLSFV